MFAGHHSDSLRKSAEKFCELRLPSIVRPGFWPRYEWHKKQGDRLVVVTATPRLILEPWCWQNDMEIIGSELETDQNGSVTGRLIGSNCMGEEKVARIKENYDLSAYSRVSAYGDTKGDLPMLGLALPEDRFYKPFR
jgi:HAD superfamily hydrolase (TIGR01490 family)